MAVKKRKRKFADSLAQARAENPMGTLNRVTIETEEYTRLKEVAREGTNAANRQKTQVEKAVKALIKDEKLTAKDEVVVGGNAYKYAVTENEVVDAEALLVLYEEDEITREQLIACMSPSKTNVSKHLGGDVLVELLRDQPGKDPGLRRRELTQKESERYSEPQIVKFAKTKKVKAAPVTSGKKTRLRLKRKQHVKV